MKFFLRSIQFLLIFVLISLLGINSASSAKEISFPEPYNCYRSFEEISTRLTELTTLYPDLARLEIIGQSSEGRDIQVLQLGREVKTNAKPRLMLVSGLKANAFALAELNLRFAETLLESFGQDANISWLLEQAEIHLIVIANPDGRLIAEQQALNGEVPSWTKNRHAYECTNGNGGVELGQNFSYGWSADGLDACSDDFSGPSAASEPETLAIQTYLDQILAQNPEQSLVIDLQNQGDLLITPFLYSKIVENPFEDDLYMLASKLSYATEAMPARGSSNSFDSVTGNLTDFAFGHLEAPSLRFNLGPAMAGGDVTSCWYFDETLKPEGLATLTRAARLAVDPLTQGQGPEINFTNIINYPYTIHIEGQADDATFYKPPLNPGNFSALHHVSYSLDTPPWFPDAVMTQIPGQSLPETPYLMDFQQTFNLFEFAPGKHTLFFQAWDTNPLGDAGQAGMINAIEINVPFFTYIPLLIR